MHAQHLPSRLQDDNLNDEQQLYARFEALLTEHDFNFKRGLPLRCPKISRRTLVQLKGHQPDMSIVLCMTHELDA